MDRINEPDMSFSKCEICNQLIGPNAPAIEVLYGFVGEDGFYIQESIILHFECNHGDVIEHITNKLEKN